MATIDDMLIVIDAQTERMRRELRRGDASVARFERTTNRRLKGVDVAFAGLARGAGTLARNLSLIGGVGLIGGVAGLGNLADDALRSADALANTADKLGLTVGQLQELRFAAEQNGVTAQTLDMAMQRFTRRLGEAQQGVGELKPVIDQYGIALRDSEGRLRSATSVLRDYAEVVKKARTPQEQLRLAFKAFDSEGAALVTLLRQGAIGMDEMAEEARKLGIVLDEDLVRSLAETDAELQKLDAQLKANNTRLARNTVQFKVWGSEFGVWVTDKVLAGVEALKEIHRQMERDFETKFGFPAPGREPFDEEGGLRGVNRARKADRLEIKQGIEDTNKALGEWKVTIDTTDAAFREHQETLRKTGEIGEAVASNLGGAFDDFLEGGKAGFEDFADSALKDIARVLFQQAILAPLTAGITGGLGGLISPTARAAGGPVSPGRAYMVGERGPELFVPRIPGEIRPDAGGGGPALEINVINNSSTPVAATSEERSGSGGRQLDIVLDDMTAQNIRRAGSSSQRALAQAGARQPLVGR